MARHGEFQPAAERGAVDGRHQRLRAAFDADQARVDIVRALERHLARADGFEVPDIGAGDEGGAGADQHHGARGGIGGGAHDGGIDAFGHAGAQRIDGRIVDGDNSDFILDFVSDEIGHGSYYDTPSPCEFT